VTEDILSNFSILAETVIDNVTTAMTKSSVILSMKLSGFATIAWVTSVQNLYHTSL